MPDQKLRLLYLTAEPWPTFRADVAVLFGKYLPRHSITTDLVTEREVGDSEKKWAGGESLLFEVPTGFIARHFFKSWKLFHALLTCKPSDYDAIQVRDMAVLGLIGLLMAKIKGLPFYYWLSFPQSEAQIYRAKARGIRAGLRYFLPLMQGLLGKYLLYHWVLPYADHVFVQSDKMREDVAANGIAFEKMTPVPMGVDLEVARRDEIEPSDDPRLQNKRIVVYLGTLDRARHIDKLFEMLKLALIENPDVLLVLVGDTEDSEHQAWLEERARQLGVMDSTLWTGWVATETAWRYVRAAEVGVSIFPRSFLLDSATPTKVIEYFALGVTVLANDNPDQEKIVNESNSGMCLPFTPESFTSALLQLFEDVNSNQQMSENGLAYIKAHRSYEKIALELAEQYRSLLTK